MSTRFWHSCSHSIHDDFDTDGLRGAQHRRRAGKNRSVTGLCRAMEHRARRRGTMLKLAPVPRQICPPAPKRRSCVPRGDVPRRKTGSIEGRNALLHAVAHIELNAVDLHWDLIARFSHIPMPLGFYDDWVKAADEESKHFNLMCDCLEAHGSFYGAMARPRRHVAGSPGHAV